MEENFHLINLKKDMAKREDSERIVINVGGMRHETYRSTLKSLPGTRLALLVESVLDDNDAASASEFFFDRHPGMFAYILNYYRTGKLRFPSSACGYLFEQELAFWGIKETDMEPCCWGSYSAHRDRIEALRKLGPSDSEQQDSPNLLMLNPGGSEAVPRRYPGSRRPKIWALFDDPFSSMAAEVMAVVSLIFLLVSIINTCVSTLPFFQEYQVHVEPTTNYYMDDAVVEQKVPMPFFAFFVVEAVCTVWFTIEFLVRVICCPNKLLFIRNPLNTVDFVALLPFYFEVRRSALSFSASNLLGLVRVVRYLRLLRVFKLMRDAVCVQVLERTVRASLGCCAILCASLAVTAFMFGSLFYYAESFSESRYVRNIFEGAWWAMISLTTIGYGDIYPVSWMGMIVGGLCAVTGILFLALPVPVLVNNFRISYKLVTAKRKLSLKKKYPDLSAPVPSSSRNLEHPSASPLLTESSH